MAQRTFPAVARHRDPAEDNGSSGMNAQVSDLPDSSEHGDNIAGYFDLVAENQPAGWLELDDSHQHGYLAFNSEHGTRMSYEVAPRTSNPNTGDILLIDATGSDNPRLVGTFATNVDNEYTLTVFFPDETKLTWTLQPSAKRGVEERQPAFAELAETIADSPLVESLNNKLLRLEDAAENGEDDYTDAPTSKKSAPSKHMNAASTVFDDAEKFTSYVCHELIDMLDNRPVLLEFRVDAVLRRVASAVDWQSMTVDELPSQDNSPRGINFIAALDTMPFEMRQICRVYRYCAAAKAVRELAKSPSQAALKAAADCGGDCRKLFDVAFPAVKAEQEQLVAEKVGAFCDLFAAMVNRVLKSAAFEEAPGNDNPHYGMLLGLRRPNEATSDSEYLNQVASREDDAKKLLANIARSRQRNGTTIVAYEHYLEIDRVQKLIVGPFPQTLEEEFSRIKAVRAPLTQSEAVAQAHALGLVRALLQLTAAHDEWKTPDRCNFLFVGAALAGLEQTVLSLYGEDDTALFQLITHVVRDDGLIPSSTDVDAVFAHVRTECDRLIVSSQKTSTLKQELKRLACTVLRDVVTVLTLTPMQLLRSLWYGRKSTNTIPADYDVEGRLRSCSCTICTTTIDKDAYIAPELRDSPTVPESYVTRAALFFTRFQFHGGRFTVHQYSTTKARVHAVPATMQTQPTSHAFGTLVARSVPSFIEMLLRDSVNVCHRTTAALTVDLNAPEDSLSTESRTTIPRAAKRANGSVPRGVPTTAAFIDTPHAAHEPPSSLIQIRTALLHCLLKASPKTKEQVDTIWRVKLEGEPEYHARYPMAPELPAAFDSSRDHVGVARAELDPLARRVLFHDVTPFHMDLDKFGGEKSSGTARRDVIRDSALDWTTTMLALQDAWNSQSDNPDLATGLINILGIATSPLSARIRAEDFAYAGAVPRSIVTEYLPLTLEDVLDAIVPIANVDVPFEREYDCQMRAIVVGLMRTVRAAHQRQVGFIALNPSNIFVSQSLLAPRSAPPVVKVAAFNHIRSFADNRQLIFRADTWNIEFRNYTLWIAIENANAANNQDGVPKRIADVIKRLNKRGFCVWSDLFSVGMLILEYLLRRSAIPVKTALDIRKKNSGSAISGFVRDALEQLKIWHRNKNSQSDPDTRKIHEDLLNMADSCMAPVINPAFNPGDAEKRVWDDFEKVSINSNVDLNKPRGDLQFRLCPFTGSETLIQRRLLKMLTTSKVTAVVSSVSPPQSKEQGKSAGSSSVSAANRRMLCSVDSWLQYTLHNSINTAEVVKWLDRPINAVYTISIRGGRAYKIDPQGSVLGESASSGSASLSSATSGSKPTAATVLMDVVPRQHALQFLDAIAQVAVDGTENDSRINAPELAVSLPNDRVAIIYNAPTASLAMLVMSSQTPVVATHLSAKDTLQMMLGVATALVAMQRLKIAHFNVGLWSIERFPPPTRGGPPTWKLGAIDRAAAATTRRMTRSIAQCLASPFYGTTPIRPPSSNDENGYVADTRALMAVSIGLLLRLHEPRGQFSQLVSDLKDKCVSAEYIKSQDGLAKTISEVARTNAGGRRLFNCFKTFTEIERSLGSTEQSVPDGKRCLARIYATLQRVVEHRVIPSSLLNDLKLAEQCMPQDDEGMESYLRGSADNELLPGGTTIIAMMTQVLWDVVDNRASDVVSMRTSKQYERLVAAWRVLGTHIALWLVSADCLRETHNHAFEDLSTDKARTAMSMYLHTLYHAGTSIDDAYADAIASEGEGGLKCTAIRLWMFKLLSFAMVHHMKFRQSLLSALHTYMCEFYSLRIRKTGWTGDTWKLFRPGFLPHEDMWGLPYTAPALTAPVNPVPIPPFSVGPYSEAARALSIALLNNTQLVSRWVPADDGALQRDFADRLQLSLLENGDKGETGTDLGLGRFLGGDEVDPKLREAFSEKVESITQRFLFRYDIAPVEAATEFSGCTGANVHETLPLRLGLRFIDVEASSKKWIDYLRHEAIPTALRRMTNVLVYERIGDLPYGETRFAIIVGRRSKERGVIVANVEPKLVKVSGAEAPAGTAREAETRSFSRLLRAATLGYFPGPHERALKYQEAPDQQGRLWFFRAYYDQERAPSLQEDYA